MSSVFPKIERLPDGWTRYQWTAKLLLAAAIASNRSQRIELTKYYGLLREQ